MAAGHFFGVPFFGVGFFDGLVDGVVDTGGGGNRRRKRKKNESVVIRYSDFESQEAYAAALAAVPIVQIPDEVEVLETDDDDEILKVLVLRMLH